MQSSRPGTWLGVPVAQHADSATMPFEMVLQLIRQSRSWGQICLQVERGYKSFCAVLRQQCMSIFPLQKLRDGMTNWAESWTKMIC